MSYLERIVRNLFIFLSRNTWIWLIFPQVLMVHYLYLDTHVRLGGGWGRNGYQVTNGLAELIVVFGVQLWLQTTKFVSSIS